MDECAVFRHEPKEVHQEVELLEAAAARGEALVSSQPKQLKVAHLGVAVSYFFGCECWLLQQAAQVPVDPLGRVRVPVSKRVRVTPAW